MMDERSKQVLYAIIESYIDKPEPIGSRFVTKKYSFGFSPATIRNIMADLEDVGLLAQPYTSAGRVPTDKGYRFYVDSLFRQGMEVPFIPGRQEEQPPFKDVIDEALGRVSRRLETAGNDMAEVFSEVTNVLSMASRYVGIVLPPRPEKTTFNRIDLIRYRGEHVVAILLTDEGVIKNRIIKVDPRLSQDDLNRITDYLNAEYSGRTLDEIKAALIRRMTQEKALWDLLISRAIGICEEALSFSGDEFFVSGLYDLMDLPDFADIARIREMAKAIKDKHMMLGLLDDLVSAEGVQVLIGRESSVEELKNLSIVASTYKEGDRPMGVIAVIGPTRMDYPRAIYMVDRVAGFITKALSSSV
ncbi:MAG: heat-inducible transcriptional repressor HrcA [Thermodesulfovibrionales bacterium]|jgi:heat-inducible transcriptional repressor